MRVDPEMMGEARSLVGALRDLGDLRAPAAVRSVVLDRIGLGDAYTSIQTVLGPAFVAYGPAGIRMLDPGDDPARFERAYHERFGKVPRRAPELPPRLARSIEKWQQGEGRADLEVDLSALSQFEQAVLRKALEIPRGEVRPYAWVAREIGRPKAVRAVGTALGHNPIPLLIPCHRVVRSDGSFGHYGLGDAAKRTVLESEGINPDQTETLARSGVRFYGSDTTRIFCFPTCRHARRVSPAHRMTFRSEDEARSAGYRPCKVCRPA
jgi:O-6-methylguanine DNA methyltransferase